MKKYLLGIISGKTEISKKLAIVISIGLINIGLLNADLYLWVNNGKKNMINQYNEEKEEYRIQIQKKEEEKKNLQMENLKLQEENKKKDEQLQAKKEAEKLAKKRKNKSVANHQTSNPIGTGDCYTAMKEYFPKKEWGNASLVIKHESKGNPKAVSSTNDHGCFQIHNGLSIYGNNIYNPDFNAKIAYKTKYLPRGYTPWYAVQGILW